MEVVDLWGDTVQASGVYRGFQVGLETLDAPVRERDVAIYHIFPGRSHGHVHAVEYAQVGKTVVRGIHGTFAVGHARPEVVQVLQHGGPDGDVGRIGKPYVADRILSVRLRLVGRPVPGVVADEIGQVGDTVG